MTKTEERKTPSLNRVIAELNKAHGETVIGRIADMEQLTMDRITSGIQNLDDAVGGGFPRGRMVEFYGEPSSGKSLISQKLMGQAQKLGLEVVYIDCESSFDPEFATKLGVDSQKVTVVQTGIGEDVVDIICKVLESEPGIIIVDSVAAMITRGEMEESVEKVFMAPKARLMSKGLPKINALNKKTLIIFINQIRKAVSTWGPAANTTTGGKALAFYSSIRVEVKRDRDLLFKDGKKSGEVEGQIVQFKVSKNKTAQPFKEGSFRFYYDGRFE